MRAPTRRSASLRGRLATLPAIACVFSSVIGCGSPCEEAAQICADQGRSSAVSQQAPQATCEGALEAQAICITDADSCAPDVVEACLADEDGVEGS